MTQRLRSRARRLAPVVLGFSFVLGLAADGFTNGGEGGAPGQLGGRLSGPAIQGTMTATETTDGQHLVLALTGSCVNSGEVVFALGPVDGSIEFFDADDLVGVIVDLSILPVALQACYSKLPETTRVVIVSAGDIVANAELTQATAHFTALGLIPDQ